MKWLNIDQTVKIFSGIVVGIFLFTAASCNSPVANVVDEGQISLTPEINVTPLSDELVIKVDVANLRSGPGVEFELIGTLKEDETFVIDGVSATGSWYRLIDGSWIAADFVEPVSDDVDGTAKSTSDAATPDSPAQTPTSAATLISSLSPDTPTATVTVMPMMPTPSNTITPTNSTVRCRTTANVFLLSGPGNATAYKIIGSLTTGRDVQVLGGNLQNGNHTYYKVRADSGDQGWLPSDFCPVADDPSIVFVPYPPTFTPTASPTPLPPDTLTPTPTSAPTSLRPDTPLPMPTTSPTPLPPDTLTPTPTPTTSAPTPSP